MAVVPAVVLAQNAAPRGGMPLIIAAAQSGPTVVAQPNKVQARPQKRVVKQKVQRVRSDAVVRSKVTPPQKPRAELRQTALKRTAKSKQPDVYELAPIANERLTRIEQCRERVESVLQPARLVKQAEECERDFPASQFAEELRRIAAGARQALEIQRAAGLSGDFFEDSVGDAAYRDNLGKAVRGDKDAAYRIALAYRAGMSGVVANSRRMEQWLRFSAELGSGRASWELAEFYNYGGFIADAARFEKKALDLGYRPPFRLPTRGY